MAQISTHESARVREMVDACCGTSNLVGMLSRLLRSGRKCRGCVGGCDECRVPRPFWWPQLSAEVSSHVCPGGVATLRIIVQNLGPVPRVYKVQVLPPALAGHASVSNDAFELLPFERKTVSVSFIVKGDAPVGHVDEPMVWVRGCLDHVILWRVTASKLSTTVCHEVAIADAPDYEHHWYDHFYCDHPCRNSKS